ncbi:MAG: glycerophosphodiester phosphodiesterase [Zoogloea oleivorans]|uniref:Glycerophosphodiester phosphodiesterase n=1 Tax=Zoogloea oleivorans TaxID=1552750 RepID=A0A6C2CLS4_9RHOO|nr:glycerophosphodiester phosphodiesterase [Zoogloea oleivorans]MDY0037598.1 glycerophosphodiester phosphodiesterase [Zoogloea oleivorans]TYC55147.1 glycerophosphodiester phosphodiesterase [Zoogloea oleivorans]
MPDWGWPAVIAHRCGGALAPENTLAGLGIAARLGCRAVEFDVMLSRDSVPVLIHDETLDRTAARSGHVARLAAEELLATDVGRCFHSAFAGESIPSLQLALDACRRLGLAVNVEIKPATGCEVDTGRVVGCVLKEMQPALRPQILLSSFSADALAAAAAEVPDVPRGLLVDRFSPQALLTAGRLDCVSLNLGRKHLDAAQILAARDAGFKVLVYTVNALPEARQLAAWGVAGVFSDRPDLLLPG